MNLRIGFNWGWRVQCAVAYQLLTSLSASNLRNLILVVLEREEIRHEVCGYLLLTRAADGVFMDH